jgi:hypothetical protein
MNELGTVAEALDLFVGPFEGDGDWEAIVKTATASDTVPLRRRGWPAWSARTFFAIAAVVVAIAAPLGALAYRAVVGNAPSQPEMLSGHLLLRLPADWNAAGGSIPGADSAQVDVLSSFALPRPLSLDGAPSPPPGGVSIWIRHRTGPTGAKWPRMTRLRLPRSAQRKGVEHLRVRFGGETVEIEVRFGSTPAPPLRKQANQVLGHVRHV